MVLIKLGDQLGRNGFVCQHGAVRTRTTQILSHPIRLQAILQVRLHGLGSDADDVRNRKDCNLSPSSSIVKVQQDQTLYIRFNRLYHPDQLSSDSVICHPLFTTRAILE